MKIIVINGAPQAGKDAFVDVLKSKSYVKDYFIYNYSTIDRIKTIAEQCGWDGKKDEKGRQLLSDLKDAFSNYNDLPYKDIIYKINHKIIRFNKYEVPTKNLVFFVHCREPKEIRKFRNNLNAKTFLIRRPSNTKEYHNHADRFVYNFKYDYTYINDKDFKGLVEDSSNFITNIINEDWSSFGEDLVIPWDEKKGD